MIKHPFYIGQWQATPTTNTLRLGELTKQLEPKAMDVLLLLCQRQGDVLSADDITDECWGNADIGDNPVHKAITQLRKALGDKASEPTYIETIRKRGYRIIADVNFPLENTQEAPQIKWQGGSPFPGLSAFESSDSTVFFGRNEQIATLLQQVSKQIERQRTFCLILGPSGTGKSSLVNAGVLPKLTANTGYDGHLVVSHTSLDFADISKDRLLLDFAGALLDWDIEGLPVFDGMSAETLATTLKETPGKAVELCQSACTHQDTTSPDLKPHLFLFIDRLEILLSSPLFKVEERETLLALIEQLATSGSVIIFSACRNDFYPLVVNQPSLMIDKSEGSHFDLTAPTHADLSQMIRMPATAANLTWSKDEQSGLSLDEILANEASNNPDSLPMLQYTLQELYLQRSDNDQLKANVYQALGGIEGAIGKKAEEIHQQLPQSHQQELAYVLSLLVTLNADSKTITSRAARWSQLQTQSQKDFVQAMVDSRLFVSHLQNNEPCFSVAHEALLRRWNRASQWIEDHRESLTIKGRLQELSERWLKEDKNSAYLLAAGKPLQEAITLKNNTAFTLEAQELELINTSINRVKVKRWSKRAIVALLCLLTFTSVLMSYKSQETEVLAQQRRVEAESLLGFMVGEFADKLRSVQRMDLLDGISNKALEYFSNQEALPESTLFSSSSKKITRNSQFQHAQTLQAMGEVSYSRGKTDEAEQAFRSAESILNRLLTDDRDNLELLQILGLNAFWAGQLAVDAGRLDQAQNAFEVYLDSSQRMLEFVPDDLDVKMEVAYAHLALGSVTLSRQNYPLALQSFELSLNITNEVLAKRNEDPTLLSVRTDIFSWIASTQQHLGNLTQALNIHKQAQSELEQLISTTHANASFIEPLAYSHWHQARILYNTGNDLVAYDSASKAISYFERALRQDSDNELWKQRKLAVQILQQRIASNVKEKGSSPLDSEIEVQLISLNDESIVRPSLFIDIVKYFQRRNDWERSSQFIERAEAKINKSDTNELTDLYKLALAELSLLKARQEALQNSDGLSINLCENTISLLQPILRQSKNYEYLIPYAQAHQCLNRIHQIPTEIETLKAMNISVFNPTNKYF